MPLALEAETGKLFPTSNRARDVRDALVAEARRLGVRFQFQCRVTDVVARGRWQIQTNRELIPAVRA